MKQTRATLRYAKSLFDLAIEQDILKKCKEDMQFVADTCASSKDLSLLLKSPIIKTDQKLSIFKEVLYDKMSEVSIRFVNIITNKKRESLLEGIANSFITLYKAHKNIESATVTTAFPLEETLRKEVTDFIKTYGETEVDLTEKVDEKIIGGAIIRMGDKQLDASVKKAIAELKQTFSKNLYIKDF